MDNDTELKALEEKQTSTSEVYKGNLLDVFNDSIFLPNGRAATREYIKHPGAVAIVPLTKDGKVIIERQYRYPLGRVITEIPAGKLTNKQEDRLSAAKRELSEETGYNADSWKYIGDYYPAAAYSDEVITLYLAEDLHKGNQNLDEDEFLSYKAVPLNELINEIMSNKIADGKTVCALLKTAKLVGLL